MMERGWLRLSFLTIGGQRAASYLNFVCNNEMLVYNSGLRPDTWGHLSRALSCWRGISAIPLNRA